MRYLERHYRWQWRLESTPEQLWPLVANTDRFNKDTGLPAVQRAGKPGANLRRRLRLSVLGIRVEWEEEPFEWVRPHRFGVVRRYHSGPAAELRLAVTLTAWPEGGTLLAYETWVRARNLLGAVGLPLFMRLNRRRFGAAFHRYDQSARYDRMAQKNGTAPVSVAGAPASRARLAPGAQGRLDSIAQELAASTGDAETVRLLRAAVLEGDDMDLARIRPYALADAWGRPRRQVLDICLRATRAGMLDLQWDLMCPLCRGGVGRPKLEGVSQPVHCESCNIDFSVNFERSVELTFRPSAAIRAVPNARYCVGGPQVTPHVEAQQLLAAGEKRPLALVLEQGRYRVRGPGIPGERHLAATRDGRPEIVITATGQGWPEDEAEVSLQPRLNLVNETGGQQLFILERLAWSDQAATAAEVTSRQVFRDLFAHEILRPGEQISVGSMSILFTDLKDSTRLYRDIGDAPAFGRVLDHFSILLKAVAAENGAVVKTMGDAVMAVFPRPLYAVRALMTAQQEIAAGAQGNIPLIVKGGIHCGHCIAVTLNERLDYFGTTVNLASRLERFSEGRDVIISDPVRRDPEVDAFLAAPENRVTVERFEAPLKGFGETSFALWRVRPCPPSDPKAAPALSG